MIGIFNKSSMNTYNAGTGAYRAPEIRKGELYLTSDTYCLGKTMYDLLQANNLLTSDRDQAMGWESLVTQMIATDPIKRPSLYQIVLSLHHLKENKKLPSLNNNISNVTVRSKIVNLMSPIAEESTKKPVTSTQKGREKWTAVEVEALLEGMLKHKIGNWVKIKKDPEFSERLKRRNNMDLKDKYKNLLCSQDPNIKAKLQIMQSFRILF